MNILLHARAPLLLNDNHVGSLNFGLSTADLARARNDVLSQGSVISIAGFGRGPLLFSAFHLGLWRPLAGLTAPSRRLAPRHCAPPLPVLRRRPRHRHRPQRSSEITPGVVLGRRRARCRAWTGAVPACDWKIGGASFSWLASSTDSQACAVL